MGGILDFLLSGVGIALIFLIIIIVSKDCAGGFIIFPSTDIVANGSCVIKCI